MPHYQDQIRAMTRFDFPLPCSTCRVYSGWARHSFRNSNPRAKRFELAAGTIWSARKAATAAVPDEPVTEEGPLVLWNKFHELLLNFLRICLASQTQTR